MQDLTGAGPAVLAADWSGAATGEQRHLWVAEWDPARAAVVRCAPATRNEAADRVLSLAAAGPLLAGLDFSFSLPAWWLDACSITGAPELWADGDRLEGWLAACAPPFWGRPGKRRPVDGVALGYRCTELAVAGAGRRPSSTFQIGGAGAVGTASLRGMPVLDRLRSEGLAIWPFDRPGTSSAVVTEVWPRPATGPVVKTDAAAREAWVAARSPLISPAARRAAVASDDAFDAVAAAIALAALGPDSLVEVADPRVRREGWICGVPLR